MQKLMEDFSNVKAKKWISTNTNQSNSQRRADKHHTLLFGGLLQGNDDEELVEEVDEIFEVLEKTVDKFYAKIEKAQAKQPTMEWD